jgi:hypothetical protein
MKKGYTFAAMSLAGCIMVLSAAKCGGKGYLTEPKIPGVGLEAPLVQVDGVPVPAIIASSAGDKTTLVSGKATLGEAIASGSYLISLQRTTGTSVSSSTASGTVLFAWTDKAVTATIDLGTGLGTHTLTFSRN